MHITVYTFKTNLTQDYSKLEYNNNQTEEMAVKKKSPF